MPFKEIHYRWQWRMRAAPEALWPLASDTNRFDFEAGLPSVARAAASDGVNGTRLRQKVLGLNVEWDESPFEWVRPHRFGVVRTFHNGPIALLRVLVELAPGVGGGTVVNYQVWITPGSLLGRVLIPMEVGIKAARAFERAFRRCDELAMRGKRPADSLEPRNSAGLAPGGRERIDAARAIILDRMAAGTGGEAARWVAGAEALRSPGTAREKGRGIEDSAPAAQLSKDALTSGGAPLLDRLIQLIETADDMTLARVRPYDLADAWRVPRRDVLALCLHATRAGLLELRWDVMCPLCRGANETAPSLGGIKPKVHCPACNIDFGVNFDRLVELTFRPTAAIRPIEVHQYCVGGPQVTPHIEVQQVLRPGEERSVEPILEPGRHRLRIPGMAGGQMVMIEAEGSPNAAFAATDATLTATDAAWPEDEITLTHRPRLTFRNATNRPQQLILERLAWTDAAATAAEVISLQVFRDLFANEALRAGEQMAVGSMTILFTDLCDSTGLYRQVGDAPAFGRVLTHFDVLRDAIAAHDGAMVKTIGDAVMAVFRRPVSALRAILAAQGSLGTRPDGKGPLLLKAGVHHGPCIAVTLNDRLDYFGSTVNIASRLGGLSTGGDVVISETVCNDPEVAELLRQSASIRAQPFESKLRGFDQERFALWRVVGLPAE